MNRPPSLLKKIWRKVRGPKTAEVKKPAPAPARKVMSSLESLEGRIAPATLINPTTLMYHDMDGDIVTVKFTKAIFNSGFSATNLANANKVFKFSTGTNAVVGGAFDPADTTHNEQLLLVDLTQAPFLSGKNAAIGSGLTITATKVGNGNGQVDVGYIRAYEPARAAQGQTPAASEQQVPLGAVVVAGDLGQIDAGGSSATLGLASLTVKTLGLRNPADTQPANDVVTLPSGRSLTSNIVGGMGAFKATGDVKGSLIVDSGAGLGKITSINIGGSLIGGTGFSTGLIDAEGAIGSVLVTGSIKGGTDGDSGEIKGGSIGAVTIGGSLESGGDSGTGVIFSKTSIGLVKITGNIDGSIGTTADSVGAGGIQALGKIAGVTVLGSLGIKGSNTATSILTGFIDAGTDLGPVVVNALTGGAGVNSGVIMAGGKIASVLVKTNVTGGSGNGSGGIVSGNDAEIPLGDLGAVKIGGKLKGGAGDSSGSIFSGGKIASVTIGPAVAVANVAQVEGGAGDFSASITSHGTMGAVKVTGDVKGGAGKSSGAIISYDRFTDTAEFAGDMGAVTISGNLIGGGDSDSGTIRAEGKLASAVVGSLLGDNGNRSGSIRAGQGVVHVGTGAITIKGDMTNGAGTETAGVIAQGKILSVLVTGSIEGGTIRAGDDIGSITVNHDINGGTNSIGGQISARGQAVQGATTDLAIGRITVLGSVSDTRIRAGYDTTLTTAVNPDAQIGTVLVKGGWTRSDLFAGVKAGGDGRFGTNDDAIISGPGTSANNAKIIAQIASITIGGQLTGNGTHYGFVSEKIVAMKIGTAVVPFTAALHQSFTLPSTPAADFVAKEV